MGKRKNRAKRSTKSLPKGLPVRGAPSGGGKSSISGSNPFEVTHRQKRAKHEVVNRPTSFSTQQQQQQNGRSRPSALADALQKRQTAVREALRRTKKANQFVDKRLGEYDRNVSAQEQALARLVRERTRRSKRSRQFALNDQDNDDNAEDDSDKNLLTHKGKAIDQLTAADHVMLSDDEEDEIGNLDALDTELHFGGSKTSQKEAAIYGASGAANDMSTQYSQKKTDLDDLILRRKIKKAERLKSKEDQVDTFQAMDESFADLAAQLRFRDKEQDIREHLQRKRAGTLSKEDQEFADWDREMKQYLHVERKVKAVDRIQTPEEIAKNEAERLHALETRRLARMNGDFDDDDFSDVDDEEEDEDDSDSQKRRRRRNQQQYHPEALDNASDVSDDEEDQLQTRFTADGLVQVDKNGVVVRKVGEDSATAEQSNNNNSKKPTMTETVVHAVGAKVTASYRAMEQYGGSESWFDGTVSAVKRDKAGNLSYDIEYDDGDFEEGVDPRHVRPVEKTDEEREKEDEKKAQEQALKRKKQKAKEKAR